MLLVVFNVNAGCIQDDVRPAWCLDNYNWNNENDTRDGWASTYGFAKNTNYILYPPWGGAYENYKLYGVYVLGTEATRFVDYDLYLDITVDGDTYTDCQFTANTWTYFNFSDLYDWDENINISFVTKQVGGLAKLFEFHLVYSYQGGALLSTFYPHHGHSCVPTTPEIDLRVVHGYCDCDEWLNVTYYYSYDGVDYIQYKYWNVSGTCPSEVDEQFIGWFAKEYNTRYWHRVKMTVGGGDVPEHNYTQTRSYYFDTELCLPPETCPNYPGIEGLEEPDCWEIISLGYNYNISKDNSTDFYFYNISSPNVKYSWDECIELNYIYDGLYHWASSETEYQNVSWFEPLTGYYLYFYENDFRIGSNRTCPDIDETMLDNAIVNLSLDHNSWVNIQWNSWFNDTNPDTLETILNIDSQYINNSSGVGCVGIVWVNFTDQNITFNVSVDKTDDTNTSIYTINDNNWLLMSGISLESGELGILIVFILFSLAFIVDKEENKNIWKPIILFLTVPISLATGIYYLGNNIFSIEWWIGILMFCFAIILSMAGLYYGLNFGRK